MTVRESLFLAKTELENRSVDSPFLDSMILLSHVLGVTKEKLLATYADPLPEKIRKEFEELVGRRKSGIPVAYLTGEKEFFGSAYRVDDRVLIPRPDTEILVEAAYDILESVPTVATVHDACTGSGCIPISLKLKFPDREISASDVSEDALEVFRLNCTRLLGTVLPHVRSDLLSSVNGNFDLITANPPYVSRRDVERIVSEGGREPVLALDGGEDGLDLIRKLTEEAMEALTPGGYFVFEIGFDQAASVGSIVSRSGFTDIYIKKDLVGLDRTVICRKGK